ncbi:nucleotide exchange factor GrpE [Candidatus Peregrinibacteria bacterium]|nr:nucleotide exchange factor GrpE [Candidatus Peregrinibacteria bacterium]
MTDEELQAELAVMTETAKRALADLQNYKRRAEEERAEITVFANIRLLQAIFPVIDNLARAFDTVPKELQSNEWLKGVQAIEKSLLTALQNLGLTAVDETGIPADANKHEVIMEVEGPAGQVMQIIEKGYTFNGKTVRAAKVAVGKG